MEAGVFDLKVAFTQIYLLNFDVPRTGAKCSEVDDAGAVLVVVGGNAGDSFVGGKLEAGAAAFGLHVNQDLKRATKQLTFGETFLRDGIELRNGEQQLYIVDPWISDLARDTAAAVLAVDNFVIAVQVFAVVFANLLVDFNNL